MKKQYFNTVGESGYQMETLAVSKPVAEKIFIQAEKRFSDSNGTPARIRPVHGGRAKPGLVSVARISAPEVWQDGALAGWLIGYRHLNAGGVLSTKPAEGWAQVVMDDGRTGAVQSQMVDNWAQLPEKLK